MSLISLLRFQSSLSVLDSSGWIVTVLFHSKLLPGQETSNLAGGENG